MVESVTEEPFIITRKGDVFHVAFPPGSIFGPELALKAIQREIELDDGEGKNDIWDFRGCHIDGTLMYNAVIGIVSHVKALREGHWHRKTAIIVDQDFQFGMARMYGALVEGLPFEVQVFRDEQEALAWLAEDSEKDPV